jgi:hypothetical protein
MSQFGRQKNETVPKPPRITFNAMEGKKDSIIDPGGANARDVIL